MAMRPVRSVSEIYPSVCCAVSPSVSYSSLTAIEGPGDDGEPQTPIFSISKSSVDVFKRDPVWAAADLRRSSSADVEQGPLQQLQGWRRVGSLQSPDPHDPPALGERWVSNMRRWSRCSGGGSAHSGCSTPDTVVWGGRTSRPCSLGRDVTCCAAPASPTTVASSPFISPLLTPTLPSVDLCTPSTLTPLASPASLPPEQRNSEGSPLTSATPPLKPFFRATNTEDDAFPGKRLLYFQYPSPMASSVCSEEGPLPSPGCPTEEETSPMSDHQARVTCSANEEQELDEGVSVCHLQLPWQPQPRRPPLVSSLSDSLLGEGCRCSRAAPQREPFFKEKARREVVDAAVQTLSPGGSCLDLRRTTSPPGSKLDLKASLGSNSNLVSPCSSMFPPGEEEEEEGKPKDVLEHRRSCLKVQTGEEKEELVGRRRSSMKQVQWDEDGMTWDVHGMSVEPEVLSAAIRKHLELHNSPQTLKRPSKKKTKAPKPPAAPPAELPDATPPSRDGGGKTEEPPTETSRAEGGEDGNDGVSKSPSLSRGAVRKRSVMRSLRPGWCGASKKEDD